MRRLHDGRSRLYGNALVYYDRLDILIICDLKTKEYKERLGTLVQKIVEEDLIRSQPDLSL